MVKARTQPASGRLKPIHSRSQTTPSIVLIILEIAFGVFITLISLLSLLKIHNEVLENELLYLDNLVIQILYSFRNTTLDNIMVFITSLGGQMIIVVGILIAMYLLAKKHKREAVLFGFILLMSSIINISLKLLVKRSRPDFDPLLLLQDYSFPSGHAMNSTVFYLTVSYLTYHFTKNKKLSLLAFFFSSGLILLIGLSRVYLGVHYLSDVLAGWLAGLCWFTSVIVIQRTLTIYHFFRHHHTS